MDRTTLTPGRFTNTLTLLVATVAGFGLCVAAGQPVSGVFSFLVAVLFAASVYALTSDGLQWRALGSLVILGFGLAFVALLGVALVESLDGGGQRYAVLSGVGLPLVVALGLGVLFLDVTRGFGARDLAVAGLAPLVGLALGGAGAVLFFVSYRIVRLLTGDSRGGSTLELVRELILAATGLNPVVALGTVLMLVSVGSVALLRILDHSSVRAAGRLVAGVLARLDRLTETEDRADRVDRPSDEDDADAPARDTGTGSGDSRRPLPVHYTMATLVARRSREIRLSVSSHLSVIGAKLSQVAVLGFFLGLLILVFGSVASETWSEVLPTAVVESLRTIGTLGTIREGLLWTVQIGVGLIAALWFFDRITVARVRKLGNTAGYAAGPLALVVGLAVTAPLLVAGLRNATALHLVLRYTAEQSRYVRVPLGDASVILYLDTAGYELVRSTPLFRATLGQLVQAVGAQTLFIAPVLAILALVLVVCYGGYLLTVVLGPPRRTGSAMAAGSLFSGAILALMAQATALYVVFITPAAFYCWHLRRLPPSLEGQVDPDAPIRRGEAIYAATSGVYLFSLAGVVVVLTLLSQRVATEAAGWQLLVAIVLLAIVSVVSLVLLRRGE